MEDLQVVEIFYCEQNLQHPSRDYFLLKEVLLVFELSFEVVLEVSFFAVFFDDVGPIFFLDDFVEGDDVGMLEPLHELHLDRVEGTSLAVF